MKARLALVAQLGMAVAAGTGNAQEPGSEGGRCSASPPATHPLR